MLEGGEFILQFGLLVVGLLGLGISFVSEDVTADTIGNLSFQDRGAQPPVAVHIFVDPGPLVSMPPFGAFRKRPLAQLIKH